jgi:hypothetical protein
MKKLVLILCCILGLTACADKENYEKAVLEQMQTDKDVTDYKIAPEHIAKCVVDLSAKNMPGLFAYDPARLTAYRNYTKMLSLKQAKDPKKLLSELSKDFGSGKALTEAHSNYTESLMNCISAVILESESATKPETPAQPAK